MRVMYGVIGVVVLVALGAVAGCREEKEPAREFAPVGGLSADVRAKLDEMDYFDSKSDMTVSMCAACKLGMEGSPKHMAHMGAYKLHFCSEGCKKRFCKDLTASILAVKVPEK